MQISGRCIQIINKDQNTSMVKFLVNTLKIDNRPNIRDIQCIIYGVEPDKYSMYDFYGDLTENNIFMVVRMYRTFHDSQDAVKYLAKSVNGISTKTAYEIVNVLGKDIFSYVNIENVQIKLQKIKGIGAKTTQALLQFIKNTSNTDEVYRFLLNNGIDYHAASEFVDSTKQDHMKIIMENPYIFMKYGERFYSCDKLAHACNVSPYDIKRVESMIQEAIHNIESSGNTRATMDDFLLQLQWIEMKSNYYSGYIPKILYEYILKYNKYISVYFEDGIEYVQSKQLEYYENEIVSNLKRIYATGKLECDHVKDVIKDIEKSNNIVYNNEQCSVFEMLNSNGVNILTGGPGTGKTTTISGLVKAIKKEFPNKRLLLCAPTGRAAARIAELTGEEAKTMHKAMKMTWCGKNEMKTEMLDANIIIVDEMSMSDTEIFATFLKAIPSGTCLLLSGDYHQLPSVGPGQVFKDLIETNVYPVHMLTKVVRQQNGSSIITNAQKILEKNSINTGADFRVMTVAKDDDIINYITHVPSKVLPQILCPTKHEVFGTSALNKIIQQKQHFTDTGIMVDGIIFHVGDHIIMNNNNYEHGYMNGDLGQIIEISNGYLVIKFVDKTLRLLPNELTGMNLSYALTVHKCQGAEYDSVLIILPQQAKRMVSNELLYTAVTRAKKIVYIIETQGMLDQFIHSEKTLQRRSGLKHKLLK